VVLVHDDRDIRISFEGCQNLVAEECFAGVFSRPCGGLHDDGRVEFACGVHDGADLLHVVDVEGGQTVTIFSSMVQQLAQ